MTLRRLYTLASALALGLLLALPAAVRADHGRPLLDERLAAYSAVAQAHWGGPPPSCILDGTRILPAHAVLYDDPDPTVAARADQPGCRLWIDRDHWAKAPGGEMCTIVAHEWGHLLGHGHSGRPFALMAELPARILPGCRERVRRRTLSAISRAPACPRAASARAAARRGCAAARSR